MWVLTPGQLQITAGKSTLIGILTGLIQPKSGERMLDSRCFGGGL